MKNKIKYKYEIILGIISVLLAISVITFGVVMNDFIIIFMGIITFTSYSLFLISFIMLDRSKRKSNQERR